MKIRVDNGKYTFVKSFETGTIQILRHGEPWHEQGDAFNALVSLMAELDAARVVLDAARLLSDDAPIEIKRALERHRALVDDREVPSAWAAPGADDQVAAQVSASSAQRIYTVAEVAEIVAKVRQEAPWGLTREDVDDLGWALAFAIRDGATASEAHEAHCRALLDRLRRACAAETPK